jgi:hypothetical protein
MTYEPEDGLARGFPGLDPAMSEPGREVVIDEQFAREHGASSPKDVEGFAHLWVNLNSNFGRTPYWALRKRTQRGEPAKTTIALEPEHPAVLDHLAATYPPTPDAVIAATAAAATAAESDEAPATGEAPALVTASGAPSAVTVPTTPPPQPTDTNTATKGAK